MQKRIYLAVLVTLLTVILTGCGDSTDVSQDAVHDGPYEVPVIKEQPVATASDEKEIPRPLEEPSEARDYAKNVDTVLDYTTSEALFVQMPNDIQPEMSSDGANRTFSWTFSDGSEMVATFKPLGGEDSGQGLVLHMIDIKD